jgi:uncharacterized cofD-like protein
VTDGPAGGPRVVAVGGGHGLAASLRAARSYAGKITGVVSVADDGGSSGRLRRDFGIIPPGDLRKCLIALSDETSVPAQLLAAAFEHRFESDELTGHAMGNLLIAALAATTGSLQEALDEAGRLLGCAGRVVPASTEPIQLKAEADSGEIRGQTAVMHTSGIHHVWAIPADVAASPEAIEAIAEADQVVIGPGSLYTSVLAALAVPEITEAISKCPGRRVYVANLKPQRAETTGYDVAAHVAGLLEHGVPVDVVLADSSSLPLGDLGSLGIEVVETKLAKTNGLAHDPGRLSGALAALVA